MKQSLRHFLWNSLLRFISFWIFFKADAKSIHFRLKSVVKKKNKWITGMVKKKTTVVMSITNWSRASGKSRKNENGLSKFWISFIQKKRFGFKTRGPLIQMFEMCIAKPKRIIIKLAASDLLLLALTMPIGVPVRIFIDHRIGFKLQSKFLLSCISKCMVFKQQQKFELKNSKIWTKKLLEPWCPHE